MTLEKAKKANNKIQKTGAYAGFDARCFSPLLILALDALPML
jgi:hypothetical protein